MFQTEDARDWIRELVSSAGSNLIHTTLQRIEWDPYVEDWHRTEALVAAEVVAASLGRPCGGLARSISGWLKQNPLDEEELRVLALKVVDRLGSNDDLKRRLQ